MRVRRNPLNGRAVPHKSAAFLPEKASYDGACTQKPLSNFWSATENNSTNAWNVNFGSGNANNNNKYNGFRVRAVTALGEDFNKFYNTIIEAYRICLRGKSTSPDAAEYFYMADEDLFRLAYELWTGTYTPGPSSCFLVAYPVWRECFAALFRDRVVHTWLCLRIEPLFEKRYESMGNVTHACRKGYGTKSAVDSAAEGIKRVTHNYRAKAVNFKGDISGFFMSLYKPLVWQLLERFLKRHYRGDFPEIVLRIAKINVFHCPDKNCIIKTPIQMWRHIPPHKSGFSTGDDYSLPIGNLPTQLIANFFMSFFDLYVLWRLRRTEFAYNRLVDDFLITCSDKQLLLSLIPDFERFLWNYLHLKLHPDKRYIQPASHGVKFVGAVIKNGRIYISNRTVGRFMEKIHGFNILFAAGDLKLSDLERILSSMNSYLGLMRGKNTYRIRKDAIYSMHPDFWKYFYVKGPFESIHLKKKYKLTA